MIFIDNKYTNWYYSIISKAKLRNIITKKQANELLEYPERHHIVPDCFYENRSRKGPKGQLPGNPNSIENLVYLTTKEHFICHLLLTKMTTGLAKTKMSFALVLLSRSKKLQNKLNSRTYSYIRQLHSAAVSITQKGIKENHLVSKETRDKISRSNLGRKLTDETKAKMRKPKCENHRTNMKGRVIKEETSYPLRRLEELQVLKQRLNNLYLLKISYLYQ